MERSRGRHYRGREREQDGDDRRRDGRRTQGQERGSSREQEKSRRRPSKNPTRDHHRRHLEKLMEQPDKPVPIPQSSKDRKPADPPDFVRFYMGSSAGAGSEVFHVYRHLRRRENDRQDYIATKATEEEKEDEFQKTVALHRAEDNAKTAKKRAKRLKRKQRQKLKKKMALEGTAGKEASTTTEGSEGEEDKVEEEEEEEEHFTISEKNNTTCV